MNATVAEFEHAHGRSPRVLHIGNIANNAYLNARLLNAVGFDCDVICYDYYHIMGCPEWEDADFDAVIEDHFNPDWSAIDLNGFHRPEWFAQGNLASCVAYLCERRSGNRPAGNRPARRKPPVIKRIARFCRHEAGRLLRISRRASEPLGLAPAWRGLHAYLTSPASQDRGNPLLLGAAFVPYAGLSAGRGAYHLARLALHRIAFKVRLRHVGPTAEARLQTIREAFQAAFPDRPDQLEFDDMFPFASALPLWSDLLQHYDAVIGYATDGVYPLLCHKHPYLAYEHGTIRNLPFEPTAQGRLCAATYRLADAALITNCDNIDSAKRLRLDNHRFVPHPVNELRVGIDGNDGSGAGVALRAGLRARLACDFIVFHPARQHWEACRHPDWEKGNDVLIRGLAAFVAEHGRVVGAVFVDWGKTVGESKALIAELGITDRVLWIAPQPNRKMIAYIRASEVVADQFFLGAFGSLTPKALLHGCPVMLHLDEARHHWCFPELPPVVNVNTPEGVEAALTRLYQDRSYLAHLATKGRAWYERYHSANVIARTLSDAIMESIAKHQAKDPAPKS